MADKPRLLVVSQVYPFPRSSGQQQRVYYTLKAFREHFHITFLSAVDQANILDYRDKLLATCDEIILLPARYTKTRISRLYHGLIGRIFALFKGLKFSNYLIGKLELSPKRISEAIGEKPFDLVLYEYWHAVDCAAVFRARGIPVVLDMHNILWQSFSRQLDAKAWLPKWWKRRTVEKYKKQEEEAWKKFDGIIAINQAEFEYTRARVPEDIQVFYTPMGIDLALWPYCWEPADPPRVAYYGSLGSPHNQQDALTCYREIMPHIWEKRPEVEFWIVGSNPPEFIQRLSQEDGRVHVTGFVEKIQEVLKTMTLVLCPWSGTYGFRSRLVEVMALGIPVIASKEAVYGMDLKDHKGVVFCESIKSLAYVTLGYLQDADRLKEQSVLARDQAQEKFSDEITYQKLAAQI